MKFMAIGAHPDDIELGCCGLLAKYPRESVGIVMTRGEGKGGNRILEAENSFKLIPIGCYEINTLPDGQLKKHEDSMIRIIENAIKRYEPEYVITHFPSVHQDHRAVYEATLQAARRHRSILLYESAMNPFETMPNIYIDIEATLQIKLLCLYAHRSQDIKGDAVRSLAEMRGMQGKIYAPAEAFQVYRLGGEIFA